MGKFTVLLSDLPTPTKRGRDGPPSFQICFLLNVAVAVDSDGGSVGSRLHGHVVGDGDLAVEHGLHQGLVVVLGEAVAPLSGLHGQLDVVGSGIVAGHQAQGLDLAASSWRSRR